MPYADTFDYFEFKIAGLSYKSVTAWQSSGVYYSEDDNANLTQPWHFARQIRIDVPDDFIIPEDLDFTPGPHIADFFQQASDGLSFSVANMTYSVSLKTVIGHPFQEFVDKAKEFAWHVVDSAGAKVGFTHLADTLKNVGLVSSFLQDIVIGKGLDLVQTVADGALGNASMTNAEAAHIAGLLDTFAQELSDRNQQDIIDLIVFPGEPAKEKVLDDLLKTGRMVASFDRGGSVSIGTLQLDCVFQMGGTEIAIPGLARSNVIIGYQNVHAGNGDDVVVSGLGDGFYDGGSGRDIIAAGGGSDHVDGGAGADWMIGGSGNDFYTVDNAGDTVDEHAGDGIDTVLTSVSFSLVDTNHAKGEIENITLTGNQNSSATGNDLANTITGNDGANTLYGGAGDDRLNGGLGNDRILDGDGVDNVDGSWGNDTLVVGDATIGTAEVYDGGEGNDTIDFTAFNFLPGVVIDLENRRWTFQSSYTEVITHVENVKGGGGAGQEIIGSTVANALTGGAGPDKIDGGAGADRLTGGPGKDTLIGGASVDRFDFNSIAESRPGAVLRDVITDFKRLEHDRIDLSTIDADQRPGHAGNQGFVFIGTDSFAHYHATHPTVFGMVRFSGGVLQANVNSSLAPDLEIKVSSVSAMASGDFFL